MGLGNAIELCVVAGVVVVGMRAFGCDCWEGKDSVDVGNPWLVP